MQLVRSAWGHVDGHPVEKFTIKDPDTGFTVEITDLGARLVRVTSLDRDGNLDDVNLGQDSPGLFLEEELYLGAVVGRVTNRIENSKFTLDGKEYQLFINNAGKHSIHGGKDGFHRKRWKFINADVNGREASLSFQYTSPDGEESYPGALITALTYRVTPDSLGWEFIAETDRPTIVNLTNHAYWNLDGLEAPIPTIDDHELEVDADFYMPCDETGLPTGQVDPVDDLGIDFRKVRSLSQVFQQHGDVDNNFLLNSYEEKKSVRDTFFAARLYSPRTGRTMRVYTTEPGMQVFSGNNLEGVHCFGKTCRKHSAICLETQKVPNAVNNPRFRESVILRPGQQYYHKTVHVFTAV
ncbi:MAG: aldose epimerase family protein [Candidatus Odinarchaeota archaeon]